MVINFNFLVKIQEILMKLSHWTLFFWCGWMNQVYCTFIFHMNCVLVCYIPSMFIYLSVLYLKLVYTTDDACSMTLSYHVLQNVNSAVCITEMV